MVNGKATKWKVKDAFIIGMERFSMVNSNREKQTDMVSKSQHKDLNTKEIGLIIKNRAKVKNHGIMVHLISVPTKTDYNMALAFGFGPMVVHLKAIGFKEKCVDKAYTSGRMA